MLDSRLDLNFDVIHAATGNRYVDAKDIRLFIFGPFASFSKYDLTSSSGKHIESIDHALIACLMYKLITGARGSDDLSIGCDRSRDRRKQELTINKNIKGKHHVIIYLRDVSGFAEWQKKATAGLGYRLTLTRNFDNAVLNKDNAFNIAKIKINSVAWYVPHYTPSIQQKTLLFKQITEKTPTELQYVERSVFMKEVNTKNYWSFELGTQEGKNVPIWIIVGFQRRDRQDSQNLTNDTFFRPPVSSCQCIIGTERYPDNIS